MVLKSQGDDTEVMRSHKWSCGRWSLCWYRQHFK